MRTCSSQFRVEREPGPRWTTCAAERYTLRSQAEPFPGAASTQETCPVARLLRVFQTCAVTATAPSLVEAPTLSRRTVGAEGSVVSLRGPRPHAADVTRRRTTTAPWREALPPDARRRSPRDRRAMLARPGSCLLAMSLTLTERSYPGTLCSKRTEAAGVIRPLQVEPD